jgi:hypothetical protein
MISIIQDTRVYELFLDDVMRGYYSIIVGDYDQYADTTLVANERWFSILLSVENRCKKTTKTQFWPIRVS